MGELWRLPATALSSMLERGEVSAREVLRAHLERIEQVEPRLHAFTEVLREQALEQAEASDSRRSRGESRGPLDGVPVTVKECFDVAGRSTTLGIPSWRGRVAQDDAAIVAALRGAGAVVLGRTNLSQTMLFVEARNPIYGQTANPWSLAHSPGGSSGGEAAAIASGMSPLGVGTDIGGSVRTPAHFCGIAAIKPTLDRLPMRGYRTVNAGQETVRATAGPLARTVADLGLFLRALDPPSTSALDSLVPPVPWGEAGDVELAGLRVGAYADDGLLPASPSLARAVERAAAALASRGCEIRPFQPPDVPALIRDYVGALSADGGAGMRAALSGGEVDPSMDLLLRAASVPPSVRRLASRAARAVGQLGVALLLDGVGENRVTDLWRVTARLRAYRAAFLAEMARQGLDALVCPPYATAALPHGASRGFTLASSYAMLFNATQLPAGSVAVTRAREAEAKRPPGRDLLLLHAARVDAHSAGLPVGVQIVAPPWKDHVVLALMAAVEAEVSGDPDFPRTPIDPRG